MELKELITTFRRWAWLLVLGLLVGLAGGYLASKYMKPVYEASTKLMISREIQNENTDLTGLNSQQLVQTYIQILNTKPLLDETSKRVGVAIDPDNISIQQILDTQIIEIKVNDYDPEKAALIANTMVDVLNEQNEETQAGQYATLESRLTEQVDQVKAQIDSLQSDYDRTTEADYQNQLSKVNDQIVAIQDEMLTLQTEIAGLNPAYKQADRILAAEKQARVNQLQAMFEIYEQIHANLLILGKSSQSGSTDNAPRLQQLQSTIKLYQDMHLTLIEDLEKARLARVQQTPNIVQIEEAFAPEKPVRPIPLLYTAVSGVAGLLIAVGIVLLVSLLKDEPGTYPLSTPVSDVWQLEPPDVPVAEKKDGGVRPEAKNKKVNPARQALLDKKSGGRIKNEA